MGISEGSAKGHCADGGNAVHEFIVSSDLDFGDVVANHCDPEFSLVASGGMDSLPSRVYRLVAYALFANRLIIPSRYLLQPCMTYDALVALRGLLEAGVVVPDLREGHYSFVEYLKEEGVVDKRRFGCAEFLDRYASSVYSFDIKGQSELFHRRVLEDLSEGGLLRSKLRLAGVRDSKIDALRDAFTECEGGRRSLVNLASKYVPHNEGAISKWAALRYYTTPRRADAAMHKGFSRLYICRAAGEPSFNAADRFGPRRIWQSASADGTVSQGVGWLAKESG